MLFEKDPQLLGVLRLGKPQLDGSATNKKKADKTNKPKQNKTSVFLLPRSLIWSNNIIQSSPDKSDGELRQQKTTLFFRAEVIVLVWALMRPWKCNIVSGLGHQTLADELTARGKWPDSERQEILVYNAETRDT